MPEPTCGTRFWASAHLKGARPDGAGRQAREGGWPGGRQAEADADAKPERRPNRKQNPGRRRRPGRRRLPSQSRMPRRRFPGRRFSSRRRMPSRYGCQADGSKAKGTGPDQGTAGGGKPLDPTGRGGNASIFAGVAIIAPVLIRELTSGSDPYLLLPIRSSSWRWRWEPAGGSGRPRRQAGQDRNADRSGGSALLTVMLWRSPTPTW